MLLADLPGAPPAAVLPEDVRSAESRVLSQGAEAIVFELRDAQQIVKYRPPKAWRLPELDALLRTRRMKQEVRVLRKLRAGGVAVPELRHADVANGLLFMERIEGRTLKEATWAAHSADGAVSETVRGLFAQLGEAVARMHALDVVHGDLTTSNAMVTPDGRLVLIDFGLSSQSDVRETDSKAVDLYVLERAIISTHPLEAEELVERVVMPAYVATSRALPGVVIERTLGRLEKTRMRGRKRSQLG